MIRILTALLITALSVSGANLGRYSRESKHWIVNNGFLECTFFQGCMAPVWFKDAAGAEFPLFVFHDSITGSQDGISWHLDDERWAEFKVVENSPDRFIMECTGHFCSSKPAGTNIPNKGVLAVYRYEFKSGSGDILLSIRLERKDSQDYKVKLMNLRWRKNPFNGVVANTPGGTKMTNTTLVSFADGVIKHGNLMLGFGKDNIISSQSKPSDPFLYAQNESGVLDWPADAPSLEFNAKITFRH